MKMRLPVLMKGAILGLFFVSTLWLVAGLPITFNSPDEAANFFFASAFSETGSLFSYETDNETLGGLLHPRSVTALDDRLVPRSFLGLPLLTGILGAVFGSAGMLVVTPILAVLAVLAWRGVVFAYFKDDRLADVSTFLLLIHPAFWYYSGRTMMHNVGFLAFLIFGLWFAFVRPLKERVSVPVDFALAGAMVGAALAFRTSEIVWVVPLGLMMFYWGKQQVNWKQFTAFAVGFVFVLIPFALFNQSLYGSVFSTGYTAVETVVETEVVEVTETAAEVEEPPALASVMNILFPFEIAEKAILRHAWQYGFALYPWMTAVVAIGVAMVLLRKKKLGEKKERWLLLLSALTALALWLGVVYGSWTFHDNPDPNIFSLGNSYVRYWLPLFLLASPFGAFAILKGTEFVPEKRRSAVVVGILVILSALSAQLVFFGNDGFAPTRRALVSFDEKRSAVLSQTEDNAIVIVDRSDKFIFPDRRVVVPLRDERTYDAMPAMLEVAPLYYFGITLPEQDIDYLNSSKLKTMELRIEAVETIQDETLYRIEHTDS